MSDNIKRRLARVEGRLGRSGDPTYLRAMSDEQITARLTYEATTRRRYPFEDLGDPRPALAHLSDAEVQEKLAAARARLAASKGGTG
jgi:hypothetical protein